MKVYFAGSFDPITNGHVDIVNRASELFEEVIVGVGTNSEKKYLMPHHIRHLMVEQTFKDQQNIYVESYNTLLVTTMRKHGCNVLIRGLRNSHDFEYEMNLHNANKLLYPEIETIYLPTKNSVISSSFIRELHNRGGCHELIKTLIPEDAFKVIYK